MKMVSRFPEASITTGYRVERRREGAGFLYRVAPR